MIVLILMTGPLPAIKRAFMKKGETGQCQWNLLISSLAKVGGKENIPVECKAKRITITLDDLIPYEKEAKERIKTYINPKYKEKYSQKDPISKFTMTDFFNDPENKMQVIEWTLLKKLSEEMKECWDKVMRGKMDAFSNWYWTLPGNPPAYCIICSRIKIGEEILKEYKKYYSTYDTSAKMLTTTQDQNNLKFIHPKLFTMWLENNRPLNEDQSYYQHLIENSDLVFTSNAPSPWGIVYLRVNMQQMGQWFNDLGSLIGLKEKPTNANFLFFWGYNTIAIPIEQGGLGCSPEHIID